MLVSNEIKKKIIIFEGADNLGKSYQANQLSKKFDIKIVNQPNPDNTLGYLRDILKYDKLLDITTRQMFHGFQNSVDIFEFPHDELVIMDRCYLSNVVYSSIMGVDEHIIDMMIKMNRTIWERYLSNYDIELVLFTAQSPFQDANEEDVYEVTDNWKDLNEEYKIRLMKNQIDYRIFPKNVKCHIADITLMSKEEVFNWLQLAYFTQIVTFKSTKNIENLFYIDHCNKIECPCYTESANNNCNMHVNVNACCDAEIV
jgi:nicotinamide riboside kinase